MIVGRSLAGVLAACALVTAACGGGAASGTYQNEDFGFSITRPEGWSQQEGAEGTIVAFLAPGPADDPFRENVNVVSEDVGSTALDRYTDLNLDNIRQVITDLHILESGTSTLAGEPGHRVSYTGAQGELQLRWLQAWTVQDGRGYVITYTADREGYGRYLDAAESMIASFSVDG